MLRESSSLAGPLSSSLSAPARNGTVGNAHPTGTTGTVGGARTTGLVGDAHPTLRRLVLLLALVLAPPASTFADDETPDDPRIRERDRLWVEAEQLEADGKMTDAVKVAQRMLSLETEVFGADSEPVAESHDFLAGLHLALEDFPAAEAARAEAMRIHTALYGPKDWRVIDARIALADVAIQAKLTPQQREELRQADSLNQQVVQLYQQGKFQQAIQIAILIKKSREALLGNEHPLTATSLNNLAALYDSMGDYARALPLYQQALEITKKALGDLHPSTATSLHNLALLYQSMGDYARALPLYQQALEIRKKALGDLHPDTATSLHNLAALYRAMGDYARALPLHQQALEITKKALGDLHPDTATSLNNLALLYQSMGDYARALPLHQQALEISLARLELVCLLQSEREQSAYTASVRYQLDNYLNAVAQTRQSVPDAFERILAWKGLVTARQRELRLLASQPELAPLLEQLQSLASQLAKAAAAFPTPQEKEAWQTRLTELAGQKEEVERQLAARSEPFQKARMPVNTQTLRAALPHGSVLVDFLELGQRKLIAFLVPKEGEVELLDLGDLAPIHEAIDAWRSAFGRPQRKLTREEYAKGQVAAKELRRLVWEPIEGEIGDAELVLLSPDGLLGTIPLGALAGKDEGTYLIEERTFAIVPIPRLLPVLMTGEDEERNLTGNVLLVGGIDYNAEPQALLAEARPAKKFGRGIDELRQDKQLVWKKLAGTLGEVATIKELYGQIYGAEGLLSLSRMQASEEAFRAHAPGHLYLHVATHGFFAPASLRSAEAPAETREAGMRLGSQEPRADGWPPGLLSGLVFAGANRPPVDEREDGILTAEEVASLNLSACQLCVLSACETGLGKVAGGEGLLGLQRAFQVAGADTVVASLWKVPDAETRILMERFYKNLWQAKDGKAMRKIDALREAQLWILKEHKVRRGLDIDADVPDRPRQVLGALDSHKVRRGLDIDADPDQIDEPPADAPTPPFYWAAFLLSGDWR